MYIYIYMYIWLVFLFLHRIENLKWIFVLSLSVAINWDVSVPMSWQTGWQIGYTFRNLTKRHFKSPSNKRL